MKLIRAKSANQEAFVKSIHDNVATFCCGAAGTGKSLLAIYELLKLIREPNPKIKQLIYCRPLIKEKKVEENLSPVPGEKLDKIYNYYNALWHSLDFICGKQEADKLIESGTVVPEVLSLMRGSSYHKTGIVLDEAQNLHKDGHAIKLLLTRIGKNSKVIIIGDTKQSIIQADNMDLLRSIELLNGMKSVNYVEMNDPMDVQRSTFVREVLKRYGDIN